MLYPTPNLSPSDDRVLTEIDRMRETLWHQVRATPRKLTAGLRKFLIADAVAASNFIEGFKVATVDVEDLLEGERDVEVSDENREEILSCQRMMTYIQTLHDVEDFTYSKGFLNALHWMLQGHRHSIRKPAGQWRKGPVYVTGARDPSIAAYTAPDATSVPALIQELADWLNAADGTHLLVRAAMAHLHLVSIHPWADGNGRMSRSLQTLMIAREGVLAPEFSSIEAWLGRPGNTWEYYRELTRRGSEYLPEPSRRLGPTVDAVISGRGKDDAGCGVLGRIVGRGHPCRGSEHADGPVPETRALRHLNLMSGRRIRALPARRAGAVAALCRSSGDPVSPVRAVG